MHPPGCIFILLLSSGSSKITMNLELAIRQITQTVVLPFRQRGFIRLLLAETQSQLELLN